MTTVPFQQPGCPETHGLTYTDCEQSAWAITPDGRAYQTAAAVSLVMAVTLGSPLPLWLYATPGIRAIAERAYRWVAANRQRFPGDRPYCEQYPAACGPPPAATH